MRASISILCLSLFLTACFSVPRKVDRTVILRGADPVRRMLRVEPVTWFSGDEAIQAAMEDTKCPRERVETCAPTLANGFYVRRSGGTQGFVVASGAVIELFTGNEAAVGASLSDLPAWLERHKGAVPPMDLQITGGDVTLIRERYVP